ncbi:MAG: hypothetical protein AAFP19_12445 [Bacteroidota bacterium]
MRSFVLFICFLSFSAISHAQFKASEDGLTIMVSDGTQTGRNSDTQAPSDIPTSYDQVGRKSGASTSRLQFTDPIRELGMTECIQAAAFLERPEYGKVGFMLIFSVNDSIGGKQATLKVNGNSYKGVYRLIRQKTAVDEPIPEGMAAYRAIGTFFLLGIS